MPDQHKSPIPRIYSLAEAAETLGVGKTWLRIQLAERRFAAMKRAGKWAMTEHQVLAAIEQMSTTARPSQAPKEPIDLDVDDDFLSGLSARSQTYWRNKKITGSTRSPGR
ncbi:hypothetical protein MMAD_18080 [Mycolicibacterium madagascariense]|uniref:Helix-turn-helix domain-containing protein n=1 Tax=Mycolicibacterium madagascariense TaxID=212765 RepID=A0A7I7XE71_9MYCO|nr:helix-turn-helix domain-containing protein [Mycolicibacterium madagascariense]MCV7015220.1 hypothetical protein [Mycolicibacterium madagascariense]BBZ27513.1 hypothetical protein MMAD_18080 [Mycolicibacterium madagascariense]